MDLDGLLHHARSHEWQFFVSGTHRSTKTMGERVRLCMWFKFLRRLCRMWGHPFTKFEWIFREELGETGGRLHWHALFSGLPDKLVQKRTCFAIMAMWERMGGGIIRCRVFNAALPGCDYTLKGLDDLAAANKYELGKFDVEKFSKLHVMPALCLLRQWQREIEPNRRRRKARDMRISALRDNRSTGQSSKPSQVRPESSTHPADRVGRIHV